MQGDERIASQLGKKKALLISLDFFFPQMSVQSRKKAQNNFLAEMQEPVTFKAVC